MGIGRDSTKLQMAINMKEDNPKKIIINQTQFYSLKQHRAVTQYHIKCTELNPETHKYESDEIYKTYKQINVVFFLLDYYNKICGNPYTDVNKAWEHEREKLIEGGVL